MTNVSPLSLAGATNPNTGAFVANTPATSKELFLRLFGGEVLSAFEKQLEVAPRIMTRTIPHGKSCSFPVHGRAIARHHVPGDDILSAANTTTALYYDTSSTLDGAGRPIPYEVGDSIKYLSNLGSEQKLITSTIFSLPLYSLMI